MKHIVSVGGGLASTMMLPERVVEKYGREDVVLVMARLPNEDPDVWRLCDAVEERLGLPITYIGLNMTPWDAFFKVRMMGSPRIDPCSRMLKREVVDRWIKDNYDVADVVLHVGITFHEVDRFVRFKSAYGRQGIATEATLSDDPTLTREWMMAECERRFGFIPRLYRFGFSHNNCFAPETRFLTDQGARSLGEAAGTTVNVLTTGGAWLPAQVRSFGVQRLHKVTLRRHSEEKVIYTTAGHRWITYVGSRSNQRRDMLTAELTPGTRLVSMYGRGVGGSVRPSSFGIAHGIVFGDGTKPTYAADGPAKNWTPPANVTLCGEKDAQLLRYFPLSPTLPVDGVGVRVSDLPRYFKDRPPLDESRSYLYGWLAGYFAADGTVGKDGSVLLHSASMENLLFVRDVCVRLGIGTLSPRNEPRRGIDGQISDLYHIRLMRHTLTPEFFLVAEHRRRAEEYGLERPAISATWSVVSVEDTGEDREVYCAVVPDTHCFTLEDNILTGNCGGACVKAGHKEWARLLFYLPDVYAWWEENEQRFQQEIGTDATILRDRRGGKTAPYSLRAFRERMRARWDGMIAGIDPFEGLEDTPACTFCTIAS